MKLFLLILLVISLLFNFFLGAIIWFLVTYPDSPDKHLREIMRFLEWFLLDVWTPVNIRIGIVYGFIAQFKLLAEIIFFGSGLFYLWFRVLPSRKMLVLWFLITLVGMIAVGEILIRWQIPHKMNEKANKINPQMDKINKIAEKLNV